MEEIDYSDKQDGQVNGAKRRQSLKVISGNSGIGGIPFKVTSSLLPPDLSL